MKNQLLTFVLGIFTTLACVLFVSSYSEPYSVSYQLADKAALEDMIQRLDSINIEYSYEFDYLKRYWVKPLTHDNEQVKKIYELVQNNAHNKPIKRD